MLQFCLEALTMPATIEQAVGETLVQPRKVANDMIVQRSLLPILFAVVLGIAGCAQSAPPEQVQRAKAAYAAVAARVEPALVELSVAERRIFVRDLARKGAAQDGDIVVSPVFDPKSAAYFSTIGDPTLTASIRRALGIVGDYFNILAALAEGRNIQEAKAQVDAIAGSVAGLVAMATGGVGLPVVDIVKQQLMPLIALWAEAKNTEELRRLVLEGEPTVRSLIAGLQNATIPMFETMTREPMRAARTTLADNAPARRTAFVRMEETNTLLSDYVVLLGKLNDMMSALAAAVRSPDSSSALASLAASAESVLIQARAASGAIALIKAGRAP